MIQEEYIHIQEVVLPHLKEGPEFVELLLMTNKHPSRIDGFFATYESFGKS